MTPEFRINFLSLLLVILLLSESLHSLSIFYNFASPLTELKTIFLWSSKFLMFSKMFSPLSSQEDEFATWTNFSTFPNEKNFIPFLLLVRIRAREDEKRREKVLNIFLLHPQTSQWHFKFPHDCIFAHRFNRIWCTLTLWYPPQGDFISLHRREVAFHQINNFFSCVRMASNEIFDCGMASVERIKA